MKSEMSDGLSTPKGGGWDSRRGGGGGGLEIPIKGEGKGGSCCNILGLIIGFTSNWSVEYEQAAFRDILVPLSE